MTAEKVLQGIAEVKLGKTFCLSLTLDYPGGNIINPRRHPPVPKPTERNGRPNMNYPLYCDNPTALDVVCDDQVVLTLQYSTQWDSLSHVGQMFDADGDGGAEDIFYNGYRAGTDIIGPILYNAKGDQTPTHQAPGARRLGVENMALSCVQGRAVMIDLEAHFGRSGKIVGYKDLMQVLDRDKVVIEPGDFVCIRTDFAQLLLEINKQPDPNVLFSTTSAFDGRDPKLQQWVTDSGAVALLADNYAVEVSPARPCADDPPRDVAAARTLPVQAGLLPGGPILTLGSQASAESAHQINR